MNSTAYQAFMSFYSGWGTDNWTHSWVRLNRHLADSLRVIISGGLRFDVADFAEIMSMTSGHIPGDAEQYHALAVKSGNKSAATSIDTYMDRKTLYIGRRFLWTPDRHMLRRAHVGCCLIWNGDSTTITSFSEDGESVVACAYQPHPDHYKVRRRYTITRADLSPPKPKPEQA